MSENLSNRQLAERYTATARRHYRRDRTLVPIIAFHGQQDLLVVPGDLTDAEPVPHAIARIVATLTRVTNPRTIVLVLESWSMKADSADTPLDSIPRGWMSEHADTNPDIRTAVMVQALDVKVPSQSYGLTSIDIGDPTEPAWEDIIMDGKPEGYLPDCVFHALANPFEPHPDWTLTMILDVIMHMGLIVHALKDTPIEGVIEVWAVA